MTKFEYPGLGETLYRHKLENGAQLIVIPKKGFARAYAFFATDFGSIDTKFFLDGRWQTTPDGVAHYLEHKMFDTKDGNAMQDLSVYGASPNAFTSYDVTAYHFSTTEYFDQCFKILLSFVSVPYFTEESVEKERGIIAQEIKMYEDSPDSQVGERLFEIMYRNHPVKTSIAGTVESIGNITADTLYSCHKAFYDPSNMVICVAGDLDPQHILDMAIEVLPKTAAQVSERDYGGEEPEDVVSHRTEKAMAVGANLFEIGFKLPDPGSGRAALKEEILGDLAFQVLAGGSSELFSRLYSDGTINGTFGGGYENIKGAAMLVCGGESDYPDEVLAELIAEAEKIGERGVDEALFNRLKKASYGRKLSELDSFEGLCYRHALCYFEGSEYYDFPAIYDEITAKDAADFIKNAVTAKRAALSVITALSEGEV